VRVQPIQQLIGGRLQAWPAERVDLLVQAEAPARPMPAGTEQFASGSFITVFAVMQAVRLGNINWPFTTVGFEL